MRIVRSSLLAVAVTLAASTLSCKSDDDDNSCSLATTPRTEANPVTVTYTAFLDDGDGSLSTLSYQGATDIVTVPNPALPFIVTVKVPPELPITITASGTRGSGKLSVSYSFADVLGANQQNVATCP